ncbi:carbon-monoxide dehydrogenase [Knoellia sinensis KCTC 19936]|uniref:Carbon-monoxide dehydrogenase n=1 Tax=Knoellia sinensis KCTC 19936 TaxID=1385520 RepID=A0A0A0J1L6_9MICO|nr:FAD binding domain-containing protein [Knoellia sinensis]KGN31320.1 carbon-monoxide dehydrogenase [Knoellia sinensis KCTC 19936]
MEFLAPSSLAEALEAKAAHPDAVPICGGTDVMVELNFDRRRPDHLLDLTRVPELAEWSVGAHPSDPSGASDASEFVRLGASVTYARVIRELSDRLPGLALAARTVGSPQIRNRGTVGGNLGAASPAGDSHPPLLAGGAEVELSSVRGTRLVPIDDFFTGPKQHAGAPDELITAVLSRATTGPQQFSKVGTRNAMVIAVTSLGLALHPDKGTVGVGIGSAAPTPVRASDAEGFLAAALDETGLWQSRNALPPSVATEFAVKVADAAAPIDDVRGTAAYRKHALTVLARRTLTWAWDDYRGSAA